MTLANKSRWRPKDERCSSLLVNKDGENTNQVNTRTIKNTVLISQSNNLWKTKFTYTNKSNLKGIKQATIHLKVKSKSGVKLVYYVCTSQFISYRGQRKRAIEMCYRKCWDLFELMLFQSWIGRASSTIYDHSRINRRQSITSRVVFING